MADGLGLLRLEPRAFWLMTPRELAAAMRGLFGGHAGGPAPSRGELDSLIARYPDS